MPRAANVRTPFGRFRGSSRAASITARRYGVGQAVRAARIVGKRGAIAAGVVGAVGYGVSRVMKRRKVSKKVIRGNNEERWFKTRGGRKVSRATFQRRLVRAAVNPTVFFFKYTSAEFNRAGPGSYQIGRTQSPHGAPTVQAWPVYCYNITAVNQGTTATATPMFRLHSDNTGGRFYWLGQNGQDGSGVTSANLQTRNNVNISSSGTYLPKALLDWVRIRSVVYGPKTRPGSVTFSLVKFLDDELAPEFQTSATAPLNPNQDLCNFWNPYVRKLCSNPIAGTGVKQPRKMRVISSRTIRIEPGLTTESDPNPGRRVLDWFQRMNKIVDFHSNRAYGGGTIMIDGTKVETGAGGTNLSTTPSRVRDRIYLLITASAHEMFGTTGDNSVHNADLHSSFDFHVELGIKQLDNA